MLAGLPIDGLLGTIATAWRDPGASLLLQAPPGAGKTTRVPLTLLEQDGSLLMLEPRRLAAKAAAQRLAAQLDEPVGASVGYSVRLESRTSSRTRLEVVTSGLFLRRLQADPELPGISGVIIDEFHERGADTELALVLLRQARELLHPELRLLVMSATLQIDALAQSWPEAQVLRSEGRAHPVQVLHQPPRRDEPLARQVVRGLEQHWLDQAGPRRTVLVFLPGQREIQAAQRAIASCSWSAQVELTALHGNLPLSDQARAIAPPRTADGKVVLATSIAESSLTIEAIELVIDSGLSRRNRFDPSTGMDGLVTTAASQASAAQRQGRAGRLGPGRCLRLWGAGDQQRRPAFDPPELLVADPVPLALQLALWGTPLGQGLPWLDPPATAALHEARDVLQQLGALDGDGQLSPHGRRMGQLGLHPRLAHMLLLAADRGWQQLGAAIAVLLSERDPLERVAVGSDLQARITWLQQLQRHDPHWQRLQQQRQALVQQLGHPHHEQQPPAEAASLLLSWAYPDRLALSRGDGQGRFVLRSGRGAMLSPQDPLAAQQALAVASLDGNGSEARIMLALPLAMAHLQDLATHQGQLHPQISWDRQAQRVRCEQQLRLGSLVLDRRPWNDADPEAVLAVLLPQLRSRGLEALPWTTASRQLQQRLQLAHRHCGPAWPARDEDTLLADLETWLGPHLLGLNSLEAVRTLDLGEALWADLPWERRQELEKLLPTSLTIASGRRARLDYGQGRPVLAVKLQELFGTGQHPMLLGGRLAIRLELLDPAGRPAAISEDLPHFWEHTYPQVRKQLRGRYPRHPWPDDPLQAVATGLTNRQLQSADPAQRSASR